jgi:hypothetical protein
METDEHLANHINDVLFDKWDPIGVNRYAPRDEYAEYASHIASTLRAANANDVFIYLRTVRMSRMQLPCNDQKDHNIADLIFDIMNKYSL